MLWLVMISIALILVWGASEQWDLTSLRRRIDDVLHHGHHADGSHHRH